MQLSGGWIVCRSRDAFELRAVSEKYARRIRVEFPCGAVAAWDEWALRPAAAWTIDDPWTAPLPREAPLSVRGWLPGDAMPPAAGRSPKKVKRLLSDAGITGHHRTNWPVVLAGDTIIWIPGVRLHPILHHPPSTTRHPLPYRCERHL